MKFVGGVLHVTLAMRHMVQITWHVPKFSLRKENQKAHDIEMLLPVM